MSDKILLAAFKSLDATEENVCEQICRTLAAERSDRVGYAVFDVGPNVKSQLQRTLSFCPGGILLMHEDGSLRWHHLHIEDHAYDLEQALQPFPANLERVRSAIQTSHLRKISSEFAPAARAAVGATGPIQVIANLVTTEQPDPFWCNHAYYLALEWGQLRKRPVLLVRVGISGTEASKLTALRKILETMMKQVMDENKHEQQP